MAYFRLLSQSGPAMPEQDAQVLLGLHALAVPLVLELRGSGDAIETVIGCDHRHREQIVRTIRGSAPAWELFDSKPLSTPADSLLLVTTMSRDASATGLPIREIATYKSFDPLSQVLEAGWSANPEEQLFVRLVLSPASQQLRERARESLTLPAPTQGLSGLLLSVLDMGGRVPRFEPRVQQSLEQRLMAPMFMMTGAIALTGGERYSLEARAHALDAAFQTIYDAGFGGLRLEPWLWRATPNTAPQASTSSLQTLVLSAGEIAALWHPPSDRVLTPGVVHLKRPSLPMPIALTRAQGLLLGVNHHRGQEMPVRLPPADLQAGHMAVIGRTGVGKSTFVHKLLQQLIQADKGAVALIDPPGDLSLDLATRAPLRRLADVVLLELGDVNVPPSLSFLWAPQGTPREERIEHTYSLFLLLLKNLSPTRMDDVLYALAATVCGLSEPSLLDIPRLLEDGLLRRKALAGLSDPIVLSFWSQYENLSASARRELTQPILYRLRSLLRVRAVRNLLCQRAGLDIGSIWDKGAVLLLSLSGTEIQPEADLLAEFLLAQIHLEALRRLSRAQETRTPLYLAIDESQRLSTGSLPVLLREGRKLGLSLIACTQYMEAWGETMTEAVAGTVGTLVAFRSGNTDARRLANSLKPFTPADLEDLDRYEAIVKMQLNNQTLPAFAIRTLPADEPGSEHSLASIRARSKSLYCQPRTEVEAELTPAFDRPFTKGAAADVDEE